jgi:ATP-dependent Clp protease ATP-binding subunit ClpA
MGKEDARAKALDQWVERDLSQAAAAGELPRAFQVDDELNGLTKALASGRNVLVVGPPGVGKTALVLLDEFEKAHPNVHDRSSLSWTKASSRMAPARRFLAAR